MSGRLWRRPVELTVTSDHYRVATCWFPGDSVLPDGDYYMRGGVCWPTVGEDDSVQGVILMGALNLREDRLYVVEEREFWTVDHVMGDEGVIEYPGIVSWINQVFASWQARTYYYHAEEHVHRRYALAAYRAPMIEPKPEFVEVRWTDDDAASYIVFERDRSRQLCYRQNGLVHQQMEQRNAIPDGMYPALHALTACLVGIDLYPCRARMANRGPDHERLC